VRGRYFLLEHLDLFVEPAELFAENDEAVFGFGGQRLIRRDRRKQFGGTPEAGGGGDAELRREARNVLDSAVR